MPKHDMQYLQLLVFKLSLSLECLCDAGRSAGDQRRSLRGVWDHSVLLGAATYKFSGGFLQSPETKSKPGEITCEVETLAIIG